jgi:hypothetical protein
MMPPTPNPLSAPPTPLTRPRSISEQTQSIPNHFQQYEQNKSMHNVDDLAAYLKDPTNIYLTDDVSSVSSNSKNEIFQIQFYFPFRHCLMILMLWLIHI